MPEILKNLPSLIQKWIEPNLSAFSADRQLSVWLVALIVGGIVSIAAILFREAIGLVQWIWLSDRSENVVTAAQNTPWYVILLAPMIGGAIVGWILTNYLPLKRTGGIPDVMEARTMDGRFLLGVSCFCHFRSGLRIGISYFSICFGQHRLCSAKHRYTTFLETCDWRIPDRKHCNLLPRNFRGWL